MNRTSSKLAITAFVFGLFSPAQSFAQTEEPLSILVTEQELPAYVRSVMPYQQRSLIDGALVRHAAGMSLSHPYDGIFLFEKPEPVGNGVCRRTAHFSSLPVKGEPSLLTYFAMAQDCSAAPLTSFAQFQPRNYQSRESDEADAIAALSLLNLAKRDALSNASDWKLRCKDEVKSGGCRRPKQRLADLNLTNMFIVSATDDKMDWEVVTREAITDSQIWVIRVSRAGKQKPEISLTHQIPAPF